MIRIAHHDLAKIAREHFEGVKDEIHLSDTMLRKIILATPSELEDIVKNYSYYYECYDGHFKNKYKYFSAKKDTEKGYDAYDLAKKLQVNVCPYCNENSTYTIGEEDKESKRTRPEFDHFYDKATYPILSLSFYNLIPCCHICNATLKTTKKFTLKSHIHPYHDSFDKEAVFRLKIEGVSFYHDTNGFSVNLETKSEKAENSAKDFIIEERYQKHKDIILELIQKEVMYSESYLDELTRQYEGTLFKNREDLQRLVSGGYISEEEIGKRPLSKLIKDISRELNL